MGLNSKLRLWNLLLWLLKCQSIYFIRFVIQIETPRPKPCMRASFKPLCGGGLFWFNLFRSIDLKKGYIRFYQCGKLFASESEGGGGWRTPPPPLDRKFHEKGNSVFYLSIHLYWISWMNTFQETSCCLTETCVLWRRILLKICFAFLMCPIYLSDGCENRNLHSNNPSNMYIYLKYAERELTTTLTPPPNNQNFKKSGCLFFYSSALIPAIFIVLILARKIDGQTDRRTDERTIIPTEVLRRLNIFYIHYPYCVLKQ